LNAAMPEKTGRRAVLRKAHIPLAHLALIAALLGTGLAAGARTQQWASEYELKAAFLYNLLAFVEWPAGGIGDRIVIGVAADTPMAPMMAGFLGSKRVGPRDIEVRDVHSRSELRACNVVLFTYAERERTQEALSQLRDTSVLTVGDGEGFARGGGMVAFVTQGDGLELAINTQAAERAHIKMSSRLLSIAKLVKDNNASRGTRP
jgi:hypothetical protein